jgi:hypothetical protein
MPVKEEEIYGIIDTYFSWTNFPDAKYVIDFTG